VPGENIGSIIVKLIEADQAEPFPGIDAFGEPVLDTIRFGTDGQQLTGFGGGYE
jgi:hypothetical protein